MNTGFTLLHKTLHLERYPVELQHQSWQAWDSADEYLIEHLEESQIDFNNKCIGIFNDEFGALTCWFNAFPVVAVNDSYISIQSCRINLRNNQLSDENVQFLDCLAELPDKLDLVLIKIPKTTALLEHQLIQLQSVVHKDTTIIAAGKAKSIQKSTLALFEKYLGVTHTSLARKKSRLIFCQPNAVKQHENPYPTIWHTDNPRFEVHNHANVFSRQQLDIGARFLLEHLPDCSGKKVVDLGCGNGVIGMSLLDRFDNVQVAFFDESFMAVTSAKQNIETNMPDTLAQCEFKVSNCLEGYDELNDKQRPDVIICNPPFHLQNAITDHIAFQMFKDAHHYLNRGGELRIIGNRHLDYPKKLKRLFSGFSLVASNNKFSILSARKR